MSTVVVTRGALLVLATFVLGACKTVSDAMFAAMFLPIVALNAPFFALYGPNDGVQQVEFYPNDDRLLVLFKDGGNQGLYWSTEDDPLLRPLTDGRRVDYSPVFSPDGTQLAFVSMSREPGESRTASTLYIMDSDTGDLRVLLDDANPLGKPRFSPDGQRIALTVRGTGEDDERDVAIVEVATGEVRRLTEDPESSDFYATFISDDEILFSRYDYYGHASPISSSKWHDGAIYKMNLDDRSIMQLTEIEYTPKPALVSPDLMMLRTAPWRFARVADPGAVFEYRLSASRKPEFDGWSISESAFVDGSHELVFVARLRKDGGPDSYELALGSVERGVEQRVTDFESTLKDDRYILLNPRVNGARTRALCLLDGKPQADKNEYELWTVDLGSGEARRVELRLEVERESNIGVAIGE